MVPDPTDPPHREPSILSVVTSAGRRLLGLSQRLVPVALCALAAHAVIYGSFRPSDGVHGYFGWYEPVVFGLGAAVVVGLGALVLAVLLGRGREWTRRLDRLLPAPDESGAGLAARTVVLARAAVVFLFLQETLERSLSARRLTPATFSPSTWCLALVATATFAVLLVLASRAGARLVECVLAGGRRPVAQRSVATPWPRVALVPGRRNALANRRGLRAPPLLAG
jgi:hypothetical protein